MSCLHPLPSFLVHLYVLLCIFSCSFVYNFGLDPSMNYDDTFGSLFWLGIWTGLRIYACPDDTNMCANLRDLLEPSTLVFS